MRVSTQEFHKGMREHFGIENPGEYLDPIFLRHKVVKIDLMKFEQWLVNTHGKYGDNISLSDEIAQKFGDEAMHFIKRLI